MLNDAQTFEKVKIKEKYDILNLEVKHLNEKIENMRTCHEENAQRNQKYINEIIGDRIQFVQKLQIDLSQRDREFVLANKKIKQLNYIIQIYKDQAREFNLMNGEKSPGSKGTKK